MNQLHSFYEGSTIALMKTGGDFPYLSRADEFNVYLGIHFKRHDPVERPEDNMVQQEDPINQLEGTVEQPEDKETLPTVE